MALSLRARLTLWHTSVLAVIVAAFGAGAYAFLSRATWTRTDAALIDAATDVRAQLVAERSDQSSTRRAAAEVLPEIRFTTTAFVVYDANGTVLSSSIPPALRLARTTGVSSTPAAAGQTDARFDPARLVPFIRLDARGHDTTAHVVTLPDAEGGYRAALAPVTLADGRFTAVAARSVHSEAEMLRDARVILAIAIPCALLFSVIGGLLLARQSLAPMVQMRDQTSRIGAENLGERLPVAMPSDEVGQLTIVINGLLERVDGAFAQQRQFMADASHELRTPVAVVQNEASLALETPTRTIDEYRDALQVIRTAGRRLARIVDDLFLLARADAGELPLRRQPLYLNDVVAECGREARTLASVRGVTLAVVAADDAPFEGDEMLLRRLVLNLIDNALKHTPPEGRVDVRLRPDNGNYQLEVADTGGGVPTELRARIFDRFVRADAARAREDDTLSSGAGLGLPIARWIAEAHGGRLELERTSPSGSMFVLTLPKPVKASGRVDRPLPLG